ncbi:MAG: N-acetylmuramoyl-L-alanine amidase [Candidatus Desulfatibia sp.]|uniref:N-acetylmuramoyl-L-alanine amidase n=1 Tax=Candidatus Desulfatibia sp. TaxID=3101189 RepID=UPI002F2BE726
MRKNIKKLNTICLFACCMLVLAVLWPRTPSAATARDKYNQAETCYKKLRNNSKKQKYRDQWLKCIDKFQEVYRRDPSGPWAPAGLYMSGKLYQQLYNLSFKDSDRKEALDIYERIIKRFPQSQYRQKAANAIVAFSKAHRPKTVDVKARFSRSNRGRAKYVAAESCYNKLLKSSKKQKYRDQWLKCIDKFQEVYRHDPAGPWAAVGLYMSAELYQELYNRSYKKSDKQEALDLYGRIIKHFPRSQYRQKASAAIGSFSGAETRKVASETVKPQKTAEKPVVDQIAAEIERGSLAQVPAVKNDKISENRHAVVKGLRFWSNPSYTRIVIDADSETAFTHRLLKKDPSINKPQRLYVELDNSRLVEDLEKTIPINDNLLSDVRAGQYTPDSVRVVVDIKSFKTYKIFPLKNPFRIVIDVWGKQPQPTRAKAGTVPKGTKLPPSALAKQLALGVSRIVIDPGHGGRDYGAPGYLKGVHEKDVVLKIARRLAKKIRSKLQCEVFLTRNSDRYLTLEERTAIANTKNADLFISIHTNASRDRRAYGIETFFLNLATDEDAIMVAARENATSKKNISDLQTILSDLMQNAKINESSRLAANVQEAMHKHLRKNYSRIKNKGVKQAPFYVLLGAQMPSILIETAFISNSRECKRLVNGKYQDRVSAAIVAGIRNYIKETSPTAFIKSSPQKALKGNDFIVLVP